MKGLLVIMMVLGLVTSVSGEDNMTSNQELMITGWELPKYTLTFTADGQIEINDIPIERLSDPEIKEAIKAIAVAMKKQSENNEWVRYYDRQTGYLLKELEECAHQIKILLEIKGLRGWIK